MVSSDETYECPDCDLLRFAMGSPSTGWKIVQGKSRRPATAEEIEGLEQLEIWHAKALANRIRREREKQGRWPPKS